MITLNMEALERAIEVCGGVAALAEKVGVTQPAVSNWKSRGQVPAPHVLKIETATGGAVSRYELRPDIYGTAPAKAAA